MQIQIYIMQYVLYILGTYQRTLLQYEQQKYNRQYLYSGIIDYKIVPYSRWFTPEHNV